MACYTLFKKGVTLRLPLLYPFPYTKIVKITSFSMPAYCRYKEVLLLLVTELLKKIQFRHNQTQLEELDDESLDDDV